MLFAKVDNVLTRATISGPRRALCSCCNEEVIAKTGDINIHHWAHAVDTDCIMNSNEMSEWHIAVQSHFEDDEIEFYSDKWPNNVADVCIELNIPGYDYLVIEAQHSPISAEKIKEREAAYKNLIWVLDMNERGDIPPSFKSVSPRRIIHEKDGKFYNKYIGEKLDDVSLRDFVIQAFKCDITTTPVIEALNTRLNALKVETDYYFNYQFQISKKIEALNDEMSSIYKSAALLNVEIARPDPAVDVNNKKPITYITFTHMQLLTVNIADKDYVKALGARWNPTIKKWYCPPGKYDDKILTWCKIKD